MKIKLNNTSNKEIINNECIVISLFKTENIEKEFLLNSDDIKIIEKVFDFKLSNSQINNFTGNFLENLTIRIVKKNNPKILVILGLGKFSEINEESIRKIGCYCFDVVKSLNIKKIGIFFNFNKLSHINNSLQMLTEGILLGKYEFNKYKTNKPINSLEIINILDKNNDIKNKEIENGKLISKNINITRDLINETPRNLTPIKFSSIIKKISKDLSLDIKILEHKDLKKLKLNLITEVSSGSSKKSSPCIIRLNYKPKNYKHKKHIGLIGKGITFDSGGLDLKPPNSMYAMKSDMSGAAAVFGTMLNIAELKPNIQVTGYLTCAENSIGSKSYHPGDIIISKKGLSVEISNTDAEGRLILADTITLAENENDFDILIDIATLTGACQVALGSDTAGIFSDNDSLISDIRKISKFSGESFWHMPMISDLFEELKSDVADIKNCGNSYGGAITAALFLRKFVNNKKNWCHIDIAGPAFRDKKKSYKPKGGTGFGVRTLTDFILINAKNNK